MKKILVLMFVAIVSLNMATATEGIKKPNNNQQNFAEVRAQRMAAFEKRLGLTEEQKIKAKQSRINGHEKMKPIIDEIR